MKKLFKISFILVFIGWGMMGCATRFIKDSAPTSSVSAVAFSPDGKLALLNSYNTIKLREVASGREIRTFKGHSKSVNSVAFSPDGKLALSGSDDNTLKLWQVSTGRELRTFNGLSDSDDNPFKFQLDDNPFKLLKLRSKIRTFKGHSGPVNSVAFSPDGKLALSGSDDNTLKLWQVSTGRELRTFKGHSFHVTSVAFSPDGKLASSSDDYTLKLWQVSTGRELRTFTFNGSSYFYSVVAFSPDGTLALSGSDDNTLKLWQVSTGRELRTFKGHSDNVYSVAFSPDGKLALSGSRDLTLKLWEISTGRELSTFKGSANTIMSVAFSPDSKLALSGSYDGSTRDGSTRLWNIETGQEIAKMVSFDDGEWITVTPEGYYVASANAGQYINGSPEFNQPEKVKLALKPFVSVSPVQVATVQPVQTPVAQIQPKTKPTDTIPPRIVLNAKTRGPTNELVADTNSYTLSGQAIDDSKIAFVKVNGKKATVNQQGYFTAQLALELGKNRISVKAADIHNNVSSKNIVLSRQEIKPRFAGNYHALVIGINQYKYLNRLNTAVNDARTVAKVLKNKYGFSVTMLLNQQATRRGIMSTFNKLNRILAENDHLLIYYAGHGYYDKQGDAAYWLPADAKNDEDIEWLSASSITTHLKRYKAKNVLVVADSCYSGTLTRRRGNDINLGATPKERQRFLKKMINKPSRVLISSGGNEPVTDSGGRGHSIFAQVFLDGLRQMEKTVFTAGELFHDSHIQERVAGKVEQIPEFQTIRQSGHDSGDFVFQRK